MSEYENVFRRKELHDMYSLGEIIPLDDLYLLEDVALTIKEIDKKIEFYKNYKKKKSQDISDAVKVLENKASFYKDLMVSTLKDHKEKSVKFPGSCAISARNQKATWKIQDEEEFIAVLQEAKKAGEDVDDVLEEVIQFNVRKREANKLLLTWEQSGKLDDFLKKAKKGSGDIVFKEPAKTTVSIKFLEEDEDSIEEVDDISIPVKESVSNSSDVEDFDTL